MSPSFPDGYWTVVVPFVAPEFQTAWHPTDSTGAFSTLHRGVFHSQSEAIEWGQKNLNGTPYSLAHFANDGERLV